MKVLYNLALLGVLLLLVFTEAGRDLALGLFMEAHERLADYLTEIL